MKMQYVKINKENEIYISLRRNGYGEFSHFFIDFFNRIKYWRKRSCCMLNLAADKHAE